MFIEELHHFRIFPLSVMHISGSLEILFQNLNWGTTFKILYTLSLFFSSFFFFFFQEKSVMLNLLKLSTVPEKLHKLKACPDLNTFV